MKEWYISPVTFALNVSLYCSLFYPKTFRVNSPSVESRSKKRDSLWVNGKPLHIFTKSSDSAENKNICEFIEMQNDFFFHNIYYVYCVQGLLYTFK